MSHKILQAGWTNFKRNSYLSFAAVGVMSLVLGIFMSLFAFHFLTSELISILEKKVDITAYFVLKSDEKDILDVKKELEAIDSVTSVNYVSSEQAKIDFLARRGDDDVIRESFEQLDDNPLKASLNISAVDPLYYESITTFLEGPRFESLISKVDFSENKQVINRIQLISNAINQFGLISVLVLAVIAILVTFNTIRLTIYTQKREIEIMKLVGASNWHVKGPFIAEGGYYGVFAAVLSLAVTYPLLYVVSNGLLTYVPEVNIFNYFVSNIIQIIILVSITGIILGIVSSAIAIRRYLKV